MSKIQPTRVHGLLSSKATARRLIASTAITPATQQQLDEATIEIFEEKFQSKPVTRCRAFEPMLIGNAYIPNNSVFYLVRSQVKAYKFYVVRINERTGLWVCSSTDKLLAAKCIQKVKLFKASRQQAKVA